MPPTRPGGPTTERSIAAIYTFAFAAVLVAVLLRWSLDPLLGERLAFVTLFGAVVGVVWFGGYRAALLAAVVGFLACDYLFVDPRGALGLLEAGNVTSLLAYAFTCAIIIGLGEAMRRARRRSLEQQERLRFAMRAAKGGVWEAVPSIGEFHASDEALMVHGLSPGTRLTQQQALDAVYPEDRERVEAAIERAIQTGEHFECEHRARHQDGSLRWVLSQADVQAGSNPPRLLGLVQDITERKQTEEAMRRSFTTFETLVEQSPLGIYTVDADFKIRNMSRGAMSAFRSVQPVIGRDFAEVMHTLWDPPFAEEAIARFRHTLETGEPYVSPGLTDRRKDLGSIESYEWQLNRVTLADGRPGLVCYFFDTTTLEEARRALAKANRRKDEFLATLAHELRNPLAPIRTGLALMKIAGADADMVEQSRSMMERQLEQLVRLVDDLMDVSRITRGRVELKKQRLPLAAALDSAVEATRYLIEERRHVLKVTEPSQPIFVDADPARLAQVFANLLNNAAKYSEPGGEIRLTAEQRDGEAIVTVADRGIGIPSEKLESIFDMFSQADRRLAESQTGLGIGLTLVRTLVEMHGGSVEVASEGRGKGTTFTVRIPAVADAGDSVDDGPAEPETAAPSQCVMIVDDNRDGADSLAMALRLIGYDTHTAYDGEQAVEMVERVRPDAILLDIGLPKLDGHEACRRIRNEAWGRDVLLIAVTGWGQDEDRRRSREAGFDEHLVKPIDLQTLTRILSERQGVAD